jgi:hypothetical protein
MSMYVRDAPLAHVAVVHVSTVDIRGPCRYDTERSARLELLLRWWRHTHHPYRYPYQTQQMVRLQEASER